MRRRRDVVEWAAIENQHRASHASLLTGQLDPERAAAQREIQLLLQCAVDSLPEPFRIVLIMRVVEAMSVDETAETLAIRPETVKTRLHRARVILRRELERSAGPSLVNTFPFEGERCERTTERALDRLKSPGVAEHCLSLARPEA